jgi:beta-fructofuranosidase
MFYGPSPTSLAVSFDMREWFGTNVILKDEPLMGAHRDHFVLKTDDTYVMYATGVKDGKGCISVMVSDNLYNWKFVGYALTSGDNAPLSNCPWGAFESPFVVKREGLYYLFTTYTDCSEENYNDTLVFVSDDPLSFGTYNGDESGAKPITKLRAHAPEVLLRNGKYYITSCGWLDAPVYHRGCVSVAELVFEKE